MKLCELWTMQTMKKEGHFIFTLTFWLKGFPVKNTNIKMQLLYSYYGIEWQMQHNSHGFFPNKYVLHIYIYKYIMYVYIYYLYTPPKYIAKLLLWEVSKGNILPQMIFRKLNYSSITFSKVFRKNIFAKVLLPI